MELFKASRQWAERPDDERFSSLAELDEACRGYRVVAAEARPSWRELHTSPEGPEVVVSGSNGTPARLTHWAFGQLAARAGAPAGYLRELPSHLASDCINEGLQARASDDKALLMFHRDNGGLIMRAVTSTDYRRIWNSEVTNRLLDLPRDGWRVPPARPAREGQTGIRPATADDVLGAGAFGLSITVGAPIAPAGLYASDHDLFVFLVNESRQIADGEGSLSRGFFLWNSEVGAASFGVMSFLYRHVCGNHIVWGAKDVKELRIRHVGQAIGKAFNALRVDLVRYADRSASDDAALIERAKTYELGKTPEEVLDRLFRLRIPALTQGVADRAYKSTEKNYPADGNPRTAWGIVNGITRLSQDSRYADSRVELDKAAGKVLQVAF